MIHEMSQVQHKTIHPILKDSFNIEPFHAEIWGRNQSIQFDCHQLFFIREGSGTLQLDGDTIQLQSLTILLLPKGLVYRFTDIQPAGYLIQFGDCFWQKAPASAADCKALLFDRPDGPRTLQTTEENFNRIEAIVSSAYTEFIAPDYPNKSDALAAYLKIIIIQLANIHSLLLQHSGTFDGRLYQRFLALVQQEGRSIHQVAAFADKLGVSTRKLTDCCSQYGTGAKEIINRQLIAEAKRLLQFSSRSVKEVADDLNFSNPYQFSHYFKKYTQLSPTEYKRQFADIGI